VLGTLLPGAPLCAAASDAPAANSTANTQLIDFFIICSFENRMGLESNAPNQAQPSIDSCGMTFALGDIRRLADERQISPQPGGIAVVTGAAVATVAVRPKRARNASPPNL
jgi:hypothetical protein